MGGECAAVSESRYLPDRDSFESEGLTCMSSMRAKMNSKIEGEDEEKMPMLSLCAY